MPITKRLYPYALSSQLELRPSDPYDPTQEEKLDLSWLVRAEASDDQTQTLDLTGKDVDWREFRVTIDARLPEAEVERILPDGSNLDDDATMIIALHCPATKLREAVVLEHQEPGHWSGDVTIRRVDVQGTVRIVPRLVRRTDVPSEDGEAEGIAIDRGLIIAEGRSLALVVDPQGKPPKGGPRVSWEDFTDSANTWRKEHASDLFHLDLDEREPTLWLNAKHRAFRAALHKHDQTGRDAVIRHLGNALIAQTVWVQLFIAAVSSLEPQEDGTIGWPSEPWKRSVLGNLCTYIFKGVSEEEQLRRLHEMRASDQIGTLMTWIGSAAQASIKSHALVGRAIRAAESVPDVERIGEE